MLRFHVKICGITSAADAQVAADGGADAVGLNFYRKSPRFVSLDQARVIVRALPSDTVKVGVFVNSSPGDVRRVFDDIGLDLVQLHGDETPQDIERLKDLPVVRALRLTDAGLQPLLDYITECRDHGIIFAGILIDSFQRGVYGGTGATADWSLLSSLNGSIRGVPLILAGGLAPANVAAAIREVRPAAIDTASGVESLPGQKDPTLVRQFVAAARAAFEQSNR